MIALATLVLFGLASPASDVDLPRAQAALKRAHDARGLARVSICGDRGRQGELVRLEHDYEQLVARYQQRTGKPPIDYWVSYHGDGCELWGRYRPAVIAARLAIADAREALGEEE